MAENLSQLIFMLPDEVQQGGTLPSYFSSYTVNKGPLLWYLVPGFSCIFNFLLVILLFRMVPKCTVEMLASVSKHKENVMCLTEKISVR